MKYLLLSTDNCVPCKQARTFLRNTTLDWRTAYYHIESQIFETLDVKTTPTLVKGNDVLAVGLTDIINYVNNLTWFDVSDSIVGEEE
jgi:glutaredoxin